MKRSLLIPVLFGSAETPVGPNLLTAPTDFTNGAWVKNTSNLDILADNAIAPDGTMTADKFVAKATTSDHFAQQSFTPESGATYMAGVQIAPAGYTWAFLFTTFGGVTSSAYFDLSGAGAIGTVSNASNAAIDLSDGYYWIRYQRQATVSAAAGTFRLYIASSNGGFSFLGDGVSGFHAWGAQLVKGTKINRFVA